MKLLLEALVKKLTFMSSIELIPLLEVPGVKQVDALFIILVTNTHNYSRILFTGIPGKPWKIPGKLP